MRPVQLVVLPALQRHIGQHIRRGRLTCRGIQVKARHQRHIDDASAQVGFRGCQFLRSQRTQPIVLIAASDGDADDRHARLARLVDQAIGIAATEQLAEQHKDIAFAKNVGLRNVA